MKTTQTNRGFTLIELLIVMVIVAILAAILFPVFMTARQNAAKAACVGNEKQIVSAFMLYTQDHNGLTPPGYDRISTFNWLTCVYGTTWNQRLMKYVKKPDIFICPAVPSALVTSSSYFRPPLQLAQPSKGFPTTYGMNIRFSSGGNLTGVQPHTSAFKSSMEFGRICTLDAPPMPARTILICEAQYKIENALTGAAKPAGGGSLVYSDVGNYYYEIRWFSKPWVPRGHAGGANFIMADGHVMFAKAPVSDAAPTVSVLEQRGMRWW